MAIDLILVDCNILVALFDRTDLNAIKSSALWATVQQKRIFALFPDCVVNETLSVIGRRLNEKGRKTEIRAAFERMELFFKPEYIFWTYNYTQGLLAEVMSLLKNNDGIFSFHDALIALVMKQESLKYILSFDRHFDLFPWLTRIYEPEQLAIHLSDI